MGILGNHNRDLHANLHERLYRERVVRERNPYFKVYEVKDPKREREEPQAKHQPRPRHLPRHHRESEPVERDKQAHEERGYGGREQPQRAREWPEGEHGATQGGLHHDLI